MALPLKIDVLPEPELEFANAARDVDPRRGLGTHGPVDDRGLRSIRLGLVGLPEDVDAAKAWLSRLKQFIAAFEGNSNRFRDWPGLEEALNCKFLVEDRFVRTIEPSVYNTLFKDALTGKTFNELVELFDGRISSLFGDDSPDCIIVCIKPELGDLRVANPGLTPEERRALEICAPRRRAINSRSSSLRPTSGGQRKPSTRWPTICSFALFIVPSRHAR